MSSGFLPQGRRMTTADILTRRSGHAAGVDRRRWFMLVVLLLGQFMALLDVTIVNVAMPTMRADLHASGAALQLVVSGYAVSYAMLLITGARLGDLYGLRRMFVSGVWGFTVSSLLCGMAPDVAALIVARFVQGAAAALIMPQIISVIQAQFSGHARTKAVSAYTAIIAVGFVAGQALGGVLVSTDLFGMSWRPVFLVNVPVGIAVALLALRLVPADVARGTRRLDLAGLVTAVPAVFLVVLPLVLGREEGWPAWTFGCIAAGLSLVAVFVLVERWVTARGGDPLLNLNVLRVPGVASALVTLAAGVTAYGGFLFGFGLHLQAGLGYSALRAGLTSAPAGVMFGLGGFYWHRLPDRVRPWLTSFGLLASAGAYVLIAMSLHHGGHGGVLLLVVLAMFGTVLGTAFSSLMAHALIHVPPSSAADVSGLLTTTLQLGQVIGVATFGSVFLSLAARTGPLTSAHAIVVTLNWEALLTAIGAGLAIVLARTVSRHSANPYAER